MKYFIVNYTILFFLLGIQLAFAQMQDPPQWKNYQEILGVKNNQRQYDYAVSVIKAANLTNVLWPGEQPFYTIQLQNNLPEEIRVEGQIEILKIGTKGIHNEVWQPELYKIGTIDSLPIHVFVKGNGYLDLDLKPQIPAENGAYALVIDLGKYGRRLVTSVVRTFKSSEANIQYPQQSLDEIGPALLERLDIHAIRMGVDFVPTNFRESVIEMEKLDHKLKEYQSRHITVLLMFGEGPTLMPLGTPRSFLDSNNTALNSKQDYVWLPSLDDDFKKFVEQLCVKYGWPNGPVTAVSLWNEPWEGISISGWQADMLRYREIYSKMAEAILNARKKGADVLIGGTDSHSNAMDKLFADGKQDFLPVFDFCSIHYEGMEAPTIYPEWISRKSEKGRVKIWDTESWVGNTDDRITSVITANHAAGYDRCMGIYGGYLFSNNDPDSKQKVRTSNGIVELPWVPMAWPQTAALGAVQHMIGERKFKELLFKRGLPWVMVFDGATSEDDGTVVICGDIGEAFGAENVLFRSVRSESEMKDKEVTRNLLLKINDKDPSTDSLKNKLADYEQFEGVKMVLETKAFFKIFDTYGNEVMALNGKIIIPLTSNCYYVRTDGTPGSFKAVQKELYNASVTGYEPFEVIAHDLTDRVEKKTFLELSVTNILNRKINTSVSIHLGKLNISYPKEISFLPFETKTIKVKINSGKSTIDNTYPLRVELDAGKDGKALHYENMHANVISRLHVHIDGKLDEWKNALPQTVRTVNGSQISTTEAAWYPFKNFRSTTKGRANGYMAYDDKYFYFACKSADASPSDGSYRFANRNDDDFFYPDTSYKIDPDESWIVKENSRPAAKENHSVLQTPDSDKRIIHFWESSETTNSYAVELNLPVTHFTQVVLYLPNLDVWKARIEIYDQSTNNLLAEHTVSNFWDGIYLKVKAAGHVRIVIHSLGWWYTVKLAALFFDNLSEIAGSSSAVFISEDLDTKGNWETVYGHQGYDIAGMLPNLSDGIQIHFINREVKQTLIWPAGVRHFSYRKDPVLPDNSGLGFGFDNVLIAFNVIPIGEDGLLSNPPGTMPRFTGYKCTDYEYALNLVAEKYGGGTEVWRLLTPGLNRKHFFPRQPKSPGEGAVKDAKLVIRREGNTLITECGIPWSEIPEVRRHMEKGLKIKFSFRVNDNEGTSMELAEERSVSKKNSRAFHPDWKVHWANEVEFGFEK